MTEPVRHTPTRKPRSARTKLFGTGNLNRVTRCSVIVAHPADEVVGAGCLISKLVDVTVLHITDGAACDMHDAKAAGFERRADYAAARRAECVAALALAQVPEERVVEFAVADQHAAEYLADLTKR